MACSAERATPVRTGVPQQDVTQLRNVTVLTTRHPGESRGPFPGREMNSVFRRNDASVADCVGHVAELQAFFRWCCHVGATRQRDLRHFCPVGHVAKLRDIFGPPLLIRSPRQRSPDAAQRNPGNTQLKTRTPLRSMRAPSVHARASCGMLTKIRGVPNSCSRF